MAEKDQASCTTAAVTFKGVPAHGQPLQQVRAPYEPYAGKSGLRMRSSSSRNFGNVLACFAIALGTVMPLGVSMQMLWEPAFYYFVGGAWPCRIIAACACFVAISALANALQMTSGKRAIAVGASCGMFGIALMASAGPLQRGGFQARAELLANCRSTPLFARWQELEQLRPMPSCAGQPSVETCPGFQAKPYTEMAKQIETFYRCSGFCTLQADDAKLPEEAATAKQPAVAAFAPQMDVPRAIHQAAVVEKSRILEQTRSNSFRAQRRTELRLELARNLQDGTASFLQVENQKYNTGLFTLEAMDRTSCDAAAGFAIEQRSITAGNVLFMEGLAMLLVSLSLAVTTEKQKDEMATSEAL